MIFKNYTVKSYYDSKVLQLKISDTLNNIVIIDSATIKEQRITVDPYEERGTNDFMISTCEHLIYFSLQNDDGIAKESVELDVR